MEEISLSAVILAAPLLVMGVCWIKSKYALHVLLVLTLASIAVPVFKDVFAPTELFSLVGYLGIADQLALCVMSLVFGWTLAASGPRLSSSRWTAFFSGALMGPLVAVFFLQGQVKSQEDEAQAEGVRALDRLALGRLCLAAFAGGCVAKALLAPLFLMVSWWCWLVMLPAAGILLFLSGVHQEDLSEADVFVPPFAMGVLVLVVAVFKPDLLLWTLIVGSILLAPVALKKRQAPSLKPVLWGIGVVPVAIVAVLGGGPELISWWLESIQVNYAATLGPSLCGAGFLLSALTDPTAAGIVGASMMGNALDLKDTMLVQQLGIGVALGGIAPALLVGIFSEIYRRLFLGLGLGLLAAQILFLLV